MQVENIMPTLYEFRMESTFLELFYFTELFVSLVPNWEVSVLDNLITTNSEKSYLGSEDPYLFSSLVNHILLIKQLSVIQDNLSVSNYLTVFSKIKSTHYE